MSGMMVGAMNRLVLSSSVSLDNRRQAIDIAEVFITWQKEAKSHTVKSENSFLDLLRLANPLPALFAYSFCHPNCTCHFYSCVLCSMCWGS